MTKTLLLACTTAAALSLAACGGGADSAENDMMADDGTLMDNEAMMANDSAMMDNGAMAAPTPSSPQDYVAMAAASDMFEIESSRLATEKAQRQEVKDFAQMLIADHQKSTATLKTAAAAAEPPVTLTPQLNAEQQANIDALRNASGADFDRLYLSQQVPAHEKALAMLRGYAESDGPAQLKQHASTTAPAVEQHLTRARSLMQQ